jgi:regulator of RNase E activity RraA
MERGDAELFDLLRRRLFTAVVGDVLDSLGFTRQFLPPSIQPLREDMVIAGRAMPVLEADIPEEEAARPGEPFGLMLRALDDLKPAEVYICTGASPTYALWGEIMSARAQRLGAAGAVLDGLVRDTRGIAALGFPAFCAGKYAQDQRPRGRVADFRIPIRIGQARIEPGELIYGDLEGVLVIPRQVETEAVERALEKVEKERQVKEAIGERGLSSAEAFRTYGVL